MIHPPFASDAVTLENCESEPIHVPGAVQPLGALLAFGRDRRLCYASENAQEVLGLAPITDERLADDALPGGLHDALMPWLDDGDPIPADLMEHLFSPLKPGSVGRSRNRSGLGLGLYIADQVIKGHAGNIVVQCSDGRVDVLVRLPLPASNAPATNQNPARH